MTYHITRLGHLGDGITDEGHLVAVTLPGEEITGALSGGRIVDPKVVSPSADRVRPPCSHFRSCGGCSLQHASDSFVASWKQSVVQSALSAQGIAASFRDIQTSPARARRRAVFSGKRTKKGALIGYHARRSDVIVPITDCHILHPDLQACLPVLVDLVRIGTSRNATLSLALTLSEQGVDCAVSGGKPLDEALRMSLPQFAHSFTRLTWEDEPVFMETPPTQNFGGISVTPPPGAFLQATKAGEEALIAAVTEAVGDASRVVDLFSGCGTFSLPLAKQAVVHAVEGIAELTQSLDHGVRFASGLKTVTIETRDLFRRPLLPDELAKFDAAVIDPPRAGAEAQVAELATAKLARIAFVSCNPVTFARDARTLVSAGYRLAWVQMVDQFRWSPHVEIAALFELDT